MLHWTALALVNYAVQ